jgi:outer membrane receptor protein involved in Fe transport
MVGAYYTREKGLIDQRFNGVAIDSGQIFSDPVLRDLGLTELTSHYREIAGFANLTWHITDRFDITGGGRLSENKQDVTQITGGNPLLVGAGGALPEIESKESVFTWQVSPRFEINDATAVYARAAKGYRPGGPNVLPPAAGPDVPRSYDADTIISYELGLKTDITRGVSLDLALFHLDWKDIQLFTVIDNFGVNANGGSADSTGFEGTLQVRPMQGLNLAFNMSLIDAELSADTPPFVGGFDGDKLPWVPKTTFSANADYEWDLTGSTVAFVGATAAYTGKQKGNFEAGEVVGVDPATGEFIFEFSPQRDIPDYATLDLRAGVEFGQFTLEAFVRNLTNSRGITSLTEISDQLTGANPLPGGALRASFLQPRTVGLTFGAEF